MNVLGEECVKCHSQEFLIRYHENGSFCGSMTSTNSVERDNEHLHVVCTECLFSWVIDTMDKETEGEDSC